MSIVTIFILFLAVVIVYVALIGIFSTLFRITGLRSSKASFQTISLLTGVGFTTVESETITENPTRRRLAIACMIIGHLLSISIISLAIDAVASFDIEHLQNSWEILVISLAVFIAILVLFSLPFIKKPLSRLIEKIGFVLYVKKNKKNVLTLMDKYDKDSIYEIRVNLLPEALKGKTLYESGIKEDYSINVMLVRRRNKNINITKDTIIEEGDTILVFGSNANIRSLFDIDHTETHSEALEEAKKSNVTYIIENYKDKVMAEIKVRNVPSILEGITLYKSTIKGQYGINVMLIKRDDEIIDITKETMIEVNDTLIVFGPYKNVMYLFSGDTK